jgi:L-threonylcarbamoyladenylate synthase
VDRVSLNTVRTDTPQLFEQAIKRAAQLLRGGEVVGLPTETVYGLAANAFDESAVARIFDIKGRPAHNPIIVHIASLEMARSCVADWPELAEKLARAFWPGPLTMVLPRSERIPSIVAAGGETVGIRWPSHPLAQALIRECGFPLAAPSANLSNQLSPTVAEHVVKSLGDRVPMIIDGGPCQVGIESTVLDLTVLPPRVLRPGIIHDEALASVTGRLAKRDPDAGRSVKSPGMLPKHYAPRARLIMRHWRDDCDLRDQLAGRSLAGCHILAHSVIPSAEGFGRVSVIPHDAEAFARALYAELHRCDELGAELIVVESLPKTNEWRSIADRLKRASAA